MSRLNVEQGGQMFFWRELVSVAKDKESLAVYKIPADEGNFQLNIATMAAAMGDMFITMEHVSSMDEFIYLPTVRLRSDIGGGLNPFITDGFGSILNYFARGMFNAPEPKHEWAERLNRAANITVRHNEGDSKLSIIGIPDDDANPRFIDILVLKGGDVKLRVRNREAEEMEDVGEMLFKTREHGGKNPFVAVALTRLAKKIVKLEKKR